MFPVTAIKYPTEEIFDKQLFLPDLPLPNAMFLESEKCTTVLSRRLVLDMQRFTDLKNNRNGNKQGTMEAVYRPIAESLFAGCGFQRHPRDPVYGFFLLYFVSLMSLKVGSIQ